MIEFFLPMEKIPTTTHQQKMEWLWRQLGSAGYIVYDPETGKWTGVDYKKRGDEKC